MQIMAQSNPSNTYNLFCQDCKSIFYVTLTPISNDKQPNERNTFENEKLKKKINLLCPDCQSSNLWLWELL
jgi:ribosomal protein L33